MKMRNLLITVALTLIVTAMVPRALDAAELPNSYDMSEESLRAGFPQLTFTRFKDALVAHPTNGTTLIDKRLADLPRSHPLFVEDAFEADDVLLMEAVLSGSDNYYVVFSEGPSADPSFYFMRIGAPTDKAFAALSGDALAIPGNGSVYIVTRHNNYFTKRAKYVYEPSGLRQIHQPYFLVGLKTKTLKAVTLYDSPRDGSPVAQLPAGSDIEVLLTDDKKDSEFRTCFLVRTPFGLVGWVWVPSSQYESTLIEGISWWGD